MKNKFAYILLTLITSLSFANAEYYEQPMDMNCCCYLEMDCDMIDTDMNCQINEAYRYATLGGGPFLVIPNVGIGYRERFGKFGWDAALSFSTIGVAHQFTAHWVRHYYLSPNRYNSGYLGLGLMASGAFHNEGEGGGSLSPDFVFGKVLESSDDSRHFIEMHVAMPTLWFGSRGAECSYVPLMYIKYGFSF